MARNYITPEGILKLKEEFKELHQVERPALVKVIEWAASNGDRSENADYIYGKRRLRQIDGRLRVLIKKIEAAEVIDPMTLKSEKVIFGASVAVEDEEGEQKKYKIVGEDEYDPANFKISWRSPLATALLGKCVDDEITLKMPKGDKFYRILSIEFV